MADKVSASIGPTAGQERNQSYKDLLVWQKALDLVVQVYVLSAKFPATETYGLKAQLQRASVSVPSNIAEGQARGASSAEFGRFIRIALGSLAEVDTQLEVAIRLGFLTEDEAESAFAIAFEIRKMLYGLLRKLT